ncbi:MAG: glycosyltransferase family 39 protein [Nitrospinae bacterium]|nr:glycosyltransferase family 39 protein [Nitrospinota bacterium]
MTHNSPLLRRLLLGGALLYGLSLLWYLVVGEYLLDLSFVIRLDDLRNTLVLFVVATLLAVGLRYAPAPWSKGGLFFEIVAWLQLPMILWYAGFGPFVWDIPLVIRTAGAGQPLVTVLALLLAAWLLPPYVSRRLAGIDREQAARLGVGLLLLVTFLLAAWLRYWNAGTGIAWYLDHRDSPTHIDVATLYIDGVYRIFSGYPYFGMHFVEWAARLWFGLAEAVNIPVPSALSDRQQVILTARLLNVLYGLGVIGLVYDIARRVGQREAGLLAAFLLATTFVPTQMAKYVGNDLPMSFFAILAVWLAARNLTDERLRWYVAAGVTLAIAFACKYNALLSFLVVGAIWLQLRNGPLDLLRRSPLLLASVAAFAVALYAATPSLWGDPVTQMERMYKLARWVATPNGIIPLEEHNPGFMVHLQALYDGFWRHVWMFEGIFLPLPLPVALAGLVWAGWRFRKRHIFIWLAPLVVFLVGKGVKPNAASYQFLHVQPLLCLAASMGLWDLLRMVRPPRLRWGSMAALALFLVYWAVQDNSLWGTKPLVRMEQEFILNNFIEPVAFRKEVGSKEFYFRHQDRLPFWRVKSDFHFADEAPGKGQTPGNTLVTISSGAPQPHTYWRDYEAAYWLKNVPAPRFFPMGHFPVADADEVIFPDRREFVETRRDFQSPGVAWKKTRFSQVILTPEQHALRDERQKTIQMTRLILAPDGLERLFLWGRNCAPEVNEVYGTVGGVPFRETLVRDQWFMKEFANPRRTPLYYHNYIEVAVGGEGAACWSVATTHREMGDLFVDAGQPENALAEYGLDTDLQAAFAAILIAPPGSPPRHEERPRRPLPHDRRSRLVGQGARRLGDRRRLFGHPLRLPDAPPGDE